MAQYNNKALSLPGEMNKFGVQKNGALKIGQDSRKKGLAATNEILFHAYQSLQIADEDDVRTAIVVSNPVIIEKDNLINYPEYDIAGDGTDSAQEFIKVYARPVEDTMCVGVPHQAIVACDFDNQFPVPPSDPVNKNLAYTILHPFFIMPVNSLGQSSGFVTPQIGDLIKVTYLDELKTNGIIVGIQQVGVGNVTSLEDLKTSAPEAFERLNRPIESVFKADKGPVATPAQNPYNISNMAAGNDVRVGTGETIETIIFDGKLIDKRVAPHLASMFRDALSQGIDFRNLTSGFRVGFIKDNIKIEEINDLTKGFTNWDGNPYPEYTRVPASQEDLRFQNCGPTQQQDPGDLTPGLKCRIATALPVKPGDWEGQQRSGHMMGNAIDVNVGSWGGRASSKIKTSRPDLITKEYRWLSLNAYKYGFIRTVKTERWHWEWLPGSNQFSKVSRDNPLWDNQFIEGFAQYEE